jgi:hypothetical protein
VKTRRIGDQHALTRRDTFGLQLRCRRAGAPLQLPDRYPLHIGGDVTGLEKMKDFRIRLA